MNYNWDDLRVFLAAARSGSLSAASRILGSNQPTISRRISTLEQALGVRLFQRHAQGLTLTEDGINILKSVEAMEHAAADLNRRQEKIADINGTVRIAAPEGLGVQLLAPALGTLLQHYPDLNVTLEPAAKSADLIRGEADIAVRLYRPEANDLVIRRLREMEFGLYASPNYLAQYGMPKSIEELNSHRFIGHGDNMTNQPECVWLNSVCDQLRYVVRSDNTLTRLMAASTGLGIAVLPKLITLNTELVELLQELTPPTRTIWLVVHRDLRDVARIRVVMDFLSETILAA